MLKYTKINSQSFNTDMINCFYNYQSYKVNLPDRIYVKIPEITLVDFKKLKFTFQKDTSIIGY
ncbi:hypothetical protein BpHYR1_051600 [Brachionus plicatilis]|uniref:Uncharacterized protein n=1 Tax=Brachionus plicatilis TaxID=10195 RepID=A0A3M7R2P2_BRAPC|nr:hypothetical protein BpHYR1_051600 [Brachionus plicatilis]